MGIRAVLWDFGGVILTSPFDAFRQFEEKCGLPQDFLRRDNATNPHGNAWACFERGEVDAARFGEMFLAESTALGHAVHGRDILPPSWGEVRARMVAAVKSVKRKDTAGWLTKKMPLGHGRAMGVSPDKAWAVAEVVALLFCVVESSRAGVRRPEPAFYERACSLLEIRP